MNSLSDSINSINHVAIIMDGNGRWAKMRSHERVWGHVRGSSVVADIVEKADNLKIKALTMYAFSSENWCRPQIEVKVLFKLLHKFLIKERLRILKNNIRFKIMGDISNLPIDTKELIYQLEDETKNNLGLKLTFAFGYGGRDEIVKATNLFIKTNPNEELTEEKLSKLMMVPDLGDVDLLIRTGGDQRVSNFLLWQIAYAEFYFTQTKWPDFTAVEFDEIIKKVSLRERRFGAISNSLNLNDNIAKAKSNKSMMRG
jgi:undecaprenyl diphosphate synthase